MIEVGLVKNNVFKIDEGIYLKKQTKNHKKILSSF